MSRDHELRTFDVYWDAIVSGEKNFEVRRDDRGFQKGDTINLVRIERRRIGGEASSTWVETRDYNNGRLMTRRKITYILTGGQFGIEPGYVVLGLKK